MARDEARVDDIPEMLVRWERKLGTRKLVIGVAGKTGNGKSTLCNNLLLLEGERSAKTGDSMVSVTPQVGLYKPDQQRLSLIVVDMPGLDAVNRDGSQVNGTKIAAQFKQATGGQVDLLLYCLSLQTGQRISAGDQLIIQKLTTTFGMKIWKHAVLVLTFANTVAAENLTEKMDNAKKAFKQLLRTELKAIGFHENAYIVDVLGSAPVGIEPHGEVNGIQWRESLLLKCLDRCDPNAVPALARLGWGDVTKDPILGITNSVISVGSGVSAAFIHVGRPGSGSTGLAPAGGALIALSLGAVYSKKLYDSPFFPVLKSSLTTKFEQWRLRDWTPGGNLSEEEKKEQATSPAHAGWCVVT